MKQAFVVVEGQTDLLILSRLLPPEIKNSVELVVGGGRYGAHSLAGSILAVDRKPVALVMDADTTNPSRIQEQRQFVADYYKSVAAGVPLETFPVSPEIEVVFFESQTVLQKLGVPTTEWESGKYHPKEVIEQALSQKETSLADLLASLTEDEIVTIRNNSFVEQLVTFLSSVTVVHQS